MNFIIYLLQAGLILVAFFSLYRVLAIRKETFHTLNRVLLLGMLALSFILPLCRITIHLPIRNTAEPTGQVAVVQTDNALMQPIAQEVIFPEENLQTQEVENTATTPRRHMNWWYVVLAVWFAGFAYNMLRIIMAYFQIRRIIRNCSIVKTLGETRIVTTTQNMAPFSWNRTVIMSQSDYDSANAGIIIDHECAHIHYHHSLDLVYVDILSALQWFNPITALLRSDLQDVHEFQADGRVLSDGYNAREYKTMLLGRLASMNGYALVSPLVRNNIGNRFDMMNRSESGLKRVFKALYVPILTAIIMSLFAVTVYDCTNGGFRGVKANNAMFGDSIKTLDAHYGQGKFSLDLWGHATIWPQQEEEWLKVETDGQIYNTTRNLIHHDLGAETQGGKPIYRVTVVLDDMNLPNVREQGLDTIQPFLNQLAKLGVRPIVVRNREQAAQTDLSTYKYARIHPTGNGTYMLNHNGLITRGSLKDMGRWINTLDIQYVAFYPDRNMPWTHAQKLMNVAVDRGVRTFFVCVRQPDGQYRMTVLPTRPEQTAKFSGKTVIQVADQLEAQVQNAFTDKAFKVIRNPNNIQSLLGVHVERISYCPDALYLVLRTSINNRNIWERPMEPGMLALKAGGQLYRLIAHEGFQEFANYPFAPENGYANGRLCWVPERGVHYTLLKFQPIPANVDQFDLVLTELPDQCLIKGIGADTEDASNQTENADGYKSLELMTPQGDLIDTDDLLADAHNRYLLLEFWSPSESQCIDNIPHLKAAHDHYADKGLAVVSICTDSILQPWFAAMSEHDMPWLQLYDCNEQSESAMSRYGIHCLPANVLIDCRTGRKVAVQLIGDAMDRILPAYFKNAH